MRDRQAVQQAGRPAVGQRLISRRRLDQGGLEGAGDDRVDGRVDRLDPVDVRRDDLAGGYLPAAQQPGQADGVLPAQLTRRLPRAG